MPKNPKQVPVQLTEHPVAVRLPPELLARVEALVRLYGTQSAVIRVALIEGLRILERRAKS